MLTIGVKMPHNTTPSAPRQQRAAKAERARKILAGVARDDSDDELGIDDHPWEWVYENASRDEAGDEAENGEEDGEKPARRRRIKPGRNKQRIVGAKMGSFKCKVGDCVLLKAEGTNTAWVGIICDFLEAINEDGEVEKQARFMCEYHRCFVECGC